MTNVSDNESSDVIEIDLQEVLGLLLHWLWLIIGCGVLAAAAGFAVSFFLITPKYESTTSVYILDKKENNSLTYSDTQLATQLTQDYEALITSRHVLEPVIESFGLGIGYKEFKDKIVVDNTTGTRIITITVKDEDPVMAQQLADAVREASAERIQSVMSTDAVNTVDAANLPMAPSEPSVMKWTAIGFLIGVFLCAVVLVVRFLLDDTIKSSEDIERYLGLSTLALIPDANVEEKKKKGKGGRKGSSGKGASGRKSSGASSSSYSSLHGGRAEGRSAYGDGYEVHTRARAGRESLPGGNNAGKRQDGIEAENAGEEQELYGAVSEGRNGIQESYGKPENGGADIEGSTENSTIGQDTVLSGERDAVFGSGQSGQDTVSEGRRSAEAEKSGRQHVGKSDRQRARKGGGQYGMRAGVRVGVRYAGKDGVQTESNELEELEL